MCRQSGEWAIISRVKIKNKFLNSLRFRILIIVILVGIIPGYMLRYGIMQNYEDMAVVSRTMEVQNQGTILANQLSAGNYLEDTQSEVLNAELTLLSGVYDGRILVIDDNFKIIKDTYSLTESKTIISEEIIKGFQDQSTTHYNAKGHYIDLTIPIIGSDSKKIIGMMMFSISTENIVANVEVLGQKAFVLQLVASIIIILIASYFSKSLVKPFQRVTRSIEDITDGYTDNMISIPDYTETELIAEAFNKLISRMKMLDNSRQEFVSNVSHELKTPITSMKVLADSLIAQEQVPIELYQEFMRDIAEEIDRENKIINDLLSLVKMDKTAADLNIMPVSINELLELILKRLRPIAAKHNIELVFESFRPVTAEIDEVKLTLALSNLVENAIKYNKVNGWVHVSLNADHKYFYVKVSDSGMGIPEDCQEHIFERFYRVDKSHSREIGGTGLGLSITRNAIIMHRGAIKVYSKEEEGTTFTVRVPLNYIA